MGETIHSVCHGVDLQSANYQALSFSFELGRTGTLLDRKACCFAGDFLPFQVIFKGQRRYTLPINTDAIEARQEGWHIMQTPTHWSTLTTCKQWVDHILRLFYTSKCRELRLHFGRQRMVLLMDCWAVHKSKDFKEWMAENHPYITLLYVPPACTAKLQPCDVNVQQPLKACFQREWHAWAVKDVATKLKCDIQPHSFPTWIEFPIATLRDMAIQFLLVAHKYISTNTDSLLKAWSTPGLDKDWNVDFEAPVDTMDNWEPVGEEVDNQDDLD